jgi:hypothetical protein
MNIVIHSPGALYRQEDGLIYLLAAFLKGVGHETALLLCDGAFATCDRDQENGWERSLTSCANCMREQSYFARLLEMPIYGISEFLAPAEIDETQRVLKGLDIAVLEQLAFHGAPLRHAPGMEHAAGQDLAGQLLRAFEGALSKRPPESKNGTDKSTHAPFDSRSRQGVHELGSEAVITLGVEKNPDSNQSVIGRSARYSLLSLLEENSAAQSPSHQGNSSQHELVRHERTYDIALATWRSILAAGKFLRTVRPGLSIVAGGRDFMSKGYLLQAQRNETRTALFRWEPSERAVVIFHPEREERIASDFVLPEVSQLRMDLKSWPSDLLQLAYSIATFLDIPVENVPVSRAR